MKRKAFIAPFWLLFVLLILFLALQTYSYSFLKNHNATPQFLQGLLIDVAIASVIIMAEALTYFFLRRRLEKKIWIRIHIFLLYFALIIVPILLSFMPFLLNEFLSNDSAFRVVTSVRFYVYWASILLAHAFFFLAIREALKNRPISDLNEQEGLFDEFIVKHN